MTHVDVVIGMEHVVEDPLQRFGERRRGVFHPRGLQYPSATPVLGPPASAGDAEGSPGQTDGDHPREQRDREEHRRDDAAHPGEAQLRDTVAERAGGAARGPYRSREPGRDQPREQAEREAARREYRHPGQHRGGRLDRVFGCVRSRQREHAGPDHFHERRRGEPGGERDDADRDGHCQSEHRRRMTARLYEHLEQRPLAHEAVERRQPDDGDGPDAEQHDGDREPTRQTAELIEIAGPGRADHGTGGQEQQALEQCVIEDVEERRRERDACQRRFAFRGEEHRGTDAHQHQPDILGGRVGEQDLDVARDERVQDPEQGRNCPERQHQPSPPARSAAQQVDADAHDPVDTERDHRPRHQRRHVARRLRMRAR